MSAAVVVAVDAETLPMGGEMRTQRTKRVDGKIWGKEKPNNPNNSSNTEVKVEPLKLPTIR